MTREEMRQKIQDEIFSEENRNKRKKILIIIIKILLIVFILGIVFMLYTNYISNTWIIVNEERIINSKIPDSFNGVKIIHFSDLHYGTTMKMDEVKNIVKLINDRNPDLVLFTGDLVDDHYDLENKEQEKLIKELDYFLGSKDNYRYERNLNNEGYKLIGGVDEVGRGPLVGPVVAACVILPVGYKLDGLTDSKKLSEKKREEYYKIIMRDAIAVGVGEISAKVIDEVNIYEASKLAMLEAIKSLKVKPDYLLIDAMKLDIDIKQTSIIKGDFLSQSIAAASVIAKVTRDHMMDDLDKIHPEYEFAKHKGYPTKRHIELLQKYGPLENYRFTYRPVCDLIVKDKE